MILALPFFGSTPSLSQVGLWQPRYSFYAGYSSAFGSLVGSRLEWQRTDQGIGFALSLWHTDRATYGGFDLTVQRAFLGGVWGLQVHYLRSLDTPRLRAGPRGFLGP